jgi:hypothetical protein
MANGYKHITNAPMREYDWWKAVAFDFNKTIGCQAVTISKKATDNTGDSLENSCSVWFKIDTDRLQLFHNLCDQRKIPYSWKNHYVIVDEKKHIIYDHSGSEYGDDLTHYFLKLAPVDDTQPQIYNYHVFMELVGKGTIKFADKITN